jgi:hypothetical protein
MQENRIWREFEALPPSAQQQVADFISFLATRTHQLGIEKNATSTPLAEESFVGVWRDRDDLRDSTAWVRRMREEQWATERD